MKKGKEVKIIGVVFIVIASILIVINALGLISLQSKWEVVLFQKYGIDVSDYIKSQTIFYIVNFVFYFSLFIFSIFTIKFKNYGRIGLNITLMLSIVYFFLVPILYIPELQGPSNPQINNNNSAYSLIFLSITIVKSLVLIFVIYFLSKKEVKEVFKPTFNV